jgi:hypothetical protein
MCPLFVDVRAAFDKVDTEKMFECMRKREREEKANGWYGRLRRKNKKQSEGGRERR